MSITVWTTIENIPYGWMRPATSIAAAIVRMAAFASSLPTEVLFESKEEPTAPLFFVGNLYLPTKTFIDTRASSKVLCGKVCKSHTKLGISVCASPLPLPRRRIWRETDIWWIAPACVSLTASAIPEAQHIPCDTLRRKDSPFTASETGQVLERSSFGGFFSRKRN